MSTLSSDHAASVQTEILRANIFGRKYSTLPPAVTSEIEGSGFEERSETFTEKQRGPAPQLEAFGPNPGGLSVPMFKVAVEQNAPIQSPGIPTDELAKITNEEVKNLEQRVKFIEAKMKDHGLL